MPWNGAIDGKRQISGCLKDLIRLSRSKEENMMDAKSAARDNHKLDGMGRYIDYLGKVHFLTLK